MKYWDYQDSEFISFIPYCEEYPGHAFAFKAIDGKKYYCSFAPCEILGEPYQYAFICDVSTLQSDNDKAALAHFRKATFRYRKHMEVANKPNILQAVLENLQDNHKEIYEAGLAGSVVFQLTNDHRVIPMSIYIRPEYADLALPKFVLDFLTSCTYKVEADQIDVTDSDIILDGSR